MPSERPERQVTNILHDIGERGGPNAGLIAELYETAYAELQSLAAGMMVQERSGHTLQPTALVNEAYLRLTANERQSWESRAHFFGAASRAMMEVLRNHAAKRNALKRGGGAVNVPFETVVDPGEIDPLVELSTLARLSDALSRINERAGRVFEMRLIGGMTQKEIAHVLGISRRTVGTDWKFARYTARELLDVHP